MYCQFFFKPKIFVLIKLLYIAISHELIVCLPTHTNLSNMITLMIYVSLTLSLSQIILISEIIIHFERQINPIHAVDVPNQEK